MYDLYMYIILPGTKLSTPQISNLEYSEMYLKSHLCF